MSAESKKAKEIYDSLKALYKGNGDELVNHMMTKQATIITIKHIISATDGMFGTWWERVLKSANEL
jgi:flagellin-specific chaperone FliS